MKHRLVIEVDGGQHNFDQHQSRDARRDAKLASEGFRILRFWNSDVDRNLSGILQVIEHSLNNPPHPTAFGGHPPPSGEG
jgi:very-short-patch-repair endonuclease